MAAIIGVGKEDAKQNFFATENVPYSSSSTAANQLNFVNNMDPYGLSSGDAVSLYKNVRNENNSSNAAKAKAILDAGMTGIQEKAAASELLPETSETFVNNLAEAIERGIANEWIQLYDLVQDKENNTYKYSEDYINACFDLLTRNMSVSDRQWIQNTLKRWRMIPQEVF